MNRLICQIQTNEQICGYNIEKFCSQIQWFAQSLIKGGQNVEKLVLKYGDSHMRRELQHSKCSKNNTKVHCYCILHDQPEFDKPSTEE